LLILSEFCHCSDPDRLGSLRAGPVNSLLKFLYGALKPFMPKPLVPKILLMTNPQEELKGTLVEEDIPIFMGGSSNHDFKLLNEIERKNNLNNWKNLNKKENFPLDGINLKNIKKEDSKKFTQNYPKTQSQRKKKNLFNKTKLNSIEIKTLANWGFHIPK